MRVLHLNFYDIEGGAAIAMHRLHSLLKKSNSIESNILAFSKQQKESNDIISFPNKFNKITNKVKRKFCFNLTKFQKINSKSTHSLNIFDSGIIKKINKIKPDIVHLHWINNEFISIKEIKKITQPIVWTFYDMWPFCGAEHWTFEKRFEDGYLNSNKPIENNGIDLNNIDKLAYLSVKRGVGLQKGQNLLITAPIDSLPFVRKICEHAYKEGAGLVTPLFTDSDITLSRFKFAPDESFDKAANWLYNGMGEAFDNNTARMAIAGDDPMLLAEMDPEKVSRANKANAIAYKPARERITEFKINWNIISWPGKA